MNKKKNIIIICSITGTVILVSVILLIINIVGNKRNKLQEMKDSIENIFFYLPEKEYDNMNEIPDYCKISFVFGQDYLKKDSYLNIESYNTEEKKLNDNNVPAYKKDNILKNVKVLLGDDATINFDMDSDMNYQFLVENGCGYNNKYITALSYNEEKEYIYSLKEEKENLYELHVKWDKEERKGNEVILEAKALLTKKNEDGSYDVYADPKNIYRVYTVEAGKNLEEELNELYEIYSNIFSFTLEKQKNNYIWKKFKLDDSKYNQEIIID